MFIQESQSNGQYWIIHFACRREKPSLTEGTHKAPLEYISRKIRNRSFWEI